MTYVHGNNEFMDMVCCGDNKMFSAIEEGNNGNVMVVGGTGSGKTVSIALPRLCHTFNSSFVMPVTKRKAMKQTRQMFVDRGYEVVCIDLDNPKQGNIGFDPLRYVKTDTDIRNLAYIIVESANGLALDKKEPYWDNAITDMMTSFIWLAVHNKEDGKGSFNDVLKLADALNYKTEREKATTNFDEVFEEMERKYPGNIGSKCWKGFSGLAATTFSCVVSTFQTIIMNYSMDEISRVVSMKRQLDIANLGKKKTALYIVTSSTEKALNYFANLLYADIFNILIKSAKKNEGECLDIPVHIICDDFATGAKISGFAEKISIFRAAGLSVTIMLQDESQLRSMYGNDEASTIINNCDTYIYMGGMDANTARNVAERVNKPMNKILNMEVGMVWIMRRGIVPINCRRYQTYEDELFIKYNPEIGGTVHVVASI